MISATARAYADFRRALARFSERPTVEAFRLVQLAGLKLDESRGLSAARGRRVRSDLRPQA
jgi:hypothetical protein